jgi:predicted metal-dependent phosphoesterase TrpH
VIDLHIHTNASSDGQHSPSEIFAMAREKNLRAISFADHNSVKNVEEGFHLSAEWGIEFFSCIELNTLHEGLDLHLLGYFIDPRSPELRTWLGEINLKKMEQAKERVENLNRLGFVFTEDDLRKYADGRIPTGRSYLQAILGRVENQGDPRLRPYIDGDRSRSPYVNFYRDYLRGGKAAFAAMEDVSTLDAITKVKRMGGTPVLAHPSDTGEGRILGLVENGLEGLEVYSPYHTPEEQKAFRTFAEARGLLMTAGSDFHGREIKPDVELGRVFGEHGDLLRKLKEKGKETGWKSRGK